jgi:Spirocyclase AveC-like
MATTVKAHATASANSRQMISAAGKLHAIHIWSGMGICFTALIVYVLANWILSGNAHTTSTGVTPVPETTVWNAIFWQAFLGLLSAILAYVVLVREWQREGRLTLNGMLYIASQTMWWQDCAFNYFTPTFTYNSILINWGSWNASIPGWVSPNAEKMPSPVLMYLGLYPVFFCGATIILVNLMKKAKARWSQLSDFVLVSTMFVTLGAFAVAAEAAWLRTGMYTYTGLASAITLWPDEAYKVPVLNIFVLDSIVLTTLACMLYYRDDKGQTFADRGYDQLRVSSKVVIALRCFSVIAVANVLMLFYNICMAYLSITGPGWAQSALEKSYFTNGVCGAGTDYACPNGSAPIPVGKNQIHLAPDGTLVVPSGAKLPQLITSKTE